MTRAQAVAMNKRFVDMKSKIDTLEHQKAEMMGLTNTYANDLWHAQAQIRNEQRTQRVQSQIVFIFWAIFISYLQFS
jgi:hypothetical protein